MNYKEHLDMDVNRKLTNLKNGVFLLHGRKATVTNVYMVDGRVNIEFKERSSMAFDRSVAEEKLKDFKPYTEDQLSVATTTHPVFGEDVKQMNNLEGTLMDCIDKVREDPNYINQANSVANLSKQVIDINKTKVKMMSEFRKYKELG